MNAKKWRTSFGEKKSQILFDMRIAFTKMHGCGNDFIFINGMKNAPNLTVDQIKKICDRHFGIGADQLFIVLPPKTNTDFKTEIYNADGGIIEMCGNGIRCFAKYVRDKGITRQEQIQVETPAGIITPQIIAGHPGTTQETIWVRVNMKEPVLEGKQILTPLALEEQSLHVICISMGNPHCVLLVDNVKKAPVTSLGPRLEHHPFFQKGVNVEFVEVVNSHHLKMRVWERGTGETLACGTGACAALVATQLLKKTDQTVTVTLLGGELKIEWKGMGNPVFMTGPATTVFEGEIDV